MEEDELEQNGHEAWSGCMENVRDERPTRGRKVTTMDNTYRDIIEAS